MDEFTALIIWICLLHHIPCPSELLEDFLSEKYMLQKLNIILNKYKFSLFKNLSPLLHWFNHVLSPCGMNMYTCKIPGNLLVYA